MSKARIIDENSIRRYFDKEGTELHDGDIIKWNSGKLERIYATNNGCLGFDATNPKWIEAGRAVACEFGIYPITITDLEMLRKA